MSKIRLTRKWRCFFRFKVHFVDFSLDRKLQFPNTVFFNLSKRAAKVCACCAMKAVHTVTHLQGAAINQALGTILKMQDAGSEVGGHFN